MDLFAGPVDPQGPPGQPGQVHDFNPGPPPQGRPFWTVRIPVESGTVDPIAGTGSYRVTDLPAKDYTFLLNALGGGPSSPSTVSFDMRWSGPTKQVKSTDSSNRYALDGAETGCTITWSAKRGDSGFSFTSDPASGNTTYAAVYRERNGVFFGATAASPMSVGPVVSGGLAGFLSRRGLHRMGPRGGGNFPD
jgi:hypothetical protein